MKIWYWGTAAAEGIPGMFCNCPICAEAREKKGKYIRTRSQIVIDDKLMVDYNPDTYMHSLKYNFNLGNLENVIITHIHEDHYYPFDFLERTTWVAHNVTVPTLHIWGSEDIYPYYLYITENNKHVVEQNRVAFHEMERFKSYEVGEYEVIPLPAEHGTPHPVVYIVKKADKNILILNDTGYLKSDTLEYLKNCGLKFDLISYDCTAGNVDSRVFWNNPRAGHMGLLNNIEIRDILKDYGYVTDKTVHVLTHFSHNGPNTGYGDMLALADKYGFVLAYDGMLLEI